MEEPELTLVSTSDISIAEMDFANLSIEEKNEARNFQVNATLWIHFIQQPIAENWGTKKDTSLFHFPQIHSFFHWNY